MSELNGYSFTQKAQLDLLATRAENVRLDILKKVSKQTFTSKSGTLTASDTQHFADIENIRNTRVALSNYNDTVDRLTSVDTLRDEKISELTAGYTAKVSTGAVAEKMKELYAISDNHDLRLDELEKRTGDIRVSLYETVIEELGKKTDTAVFDQIETALRANDTSIAQQIAQLALANSAKDVNDAQDLAIAGLVSTSDFSAKMSELTSRNQDIENRLLAVDQFFRVMGMTYKLFDKDTPDMVIDYTATVQPGITLNSSFTINGFKTVTSNRSIVYTDNLVVTLTPFCFNTLSGSIDVYDSNNQVIGSLTKEMVDVDLTAEIPITSSVKSLSSMTVAVKNMSGETVDDIALTEQGIANLVDLTPITMNLINTTLVTASATPVNVEGDVMGTGVITVTPALPAGISASVANKKLVISGSASSATPFTAHTITYSNSFSSASVIFNLTVINQAPVYTYADKSALVGNDVTITPVKVSGDDATSWSISPSLASVGLTLNASTGVISGTATAKVNQVYTVTYNNIGNTRTSTFTLVVNQAPVYTYADKSVFTGDSVTITPVKVSGDDATSWSISPSLSSVGLTLNASTGVISGVASAKINRLYTVTYNYLTDTKTATFNLAINQAPIYVYGNSSAFIGDSVTITPTKVTGDDATSWSISPSLASVGLALNASTGVISGTATAVITQVYTVTYNYLTDTKTATFTLVVNQRPVYTYSGKSAFVGDSVTITPVKVSGDDATSWSISPSLASVGLALNASTGVISGTATAVITQVYTVTYNYLTDTKTATFTLIVASPRQWTGLVNDVDEDGLAITTGAGTKYYSYNFTTGTATSYQLFAKSNSSTFTDETISYIYRDGLNTNFLSTAANVSGVSNATYNSTAGTIVFNNSLDNTSATPNLTLNNLLANTTYYIIVVTTKNDVGADLQISIENNGVNIPITYDEISLSQLPIFIWTAVWSKSMTSTNPYGITTDNFGNTYSFITKWSTTWSPNSTTGFLNSAPTAGMIGAVIKYDSVGNILWGRFFNAFIRPGVVDSNGNVYVYANNATTVNTTNFNNNYPSRGDAIIKLNSSGSQIAGTWIFQTTATSWQSVNSLRLDSTGNVYYIGNNISTCYINKLNSNLVLEWTKIVSSGSGNSFNIAPSDNMYICVSSGNNSTITKLNSSGTIVSTRTIPYSTIESIVFDSLENVYIGGWTSKQGYYITNWSNATVTFVNSFPFSGLDNNTYDVGIVIKFNSSLVGQWGRVISRAANQRVDKIAVNDTNVYVAGVIDLATDTFDTTGFTNSRSANNGFILKLNSTGQTQLSGRFISGINNGCSGFALKKKYLYSAFSTDSNAVITKYKG